MVDTRLQWGAQALQEQLQGQLPGLIVEIAASLPSTNSTLLERARIVAQGWQAPANAAAAAMVRPSVESGAFGRRAADWQPCLLVAEKQTAGRGRLGRQWHSKPLASLTFSLAIPLAPSNWSGLSLAVGVALADALDPPEPTVRPRIGIKWPNDLWLIDATEEPSHNAGGRKLGGILIETVSSGAKRLAVIGIGLNISRAAPMHAIEGSSGFASLRELEPEIHVPQALARIALPLVAALKRFERCGFGEFAQAFARRDILRDLGIVTSHQDVCEGIARGVSADGSLIVETVAGTTMLHSGEVSVRPARSDARPEEAAC